MWVTDKAVREPAGTVGPSADVSLLSREFGGRPWMGKVYACEQSRGSNELLAVNGDEIAYSSLRFASLWRKAWQSGGRVGEAARIINTSSQQPNQVDIVCPGYVIWIRAPNGGFMGTA